MNGDLELGHITLVQLDRRASRIRDGGSNRPPSGTTRLFKVQLGTNFRVHESNALDLGGRGKVKDDLTSRGIVIRGVRRHILLDDEKIAEAELEIRISSTGHVRIVNTGIVDILAAGTRIGRRRRG